MHSNKPFSSKAQNYTHAIASVELEYSSLADGVSVAGRICPKCNGGDSREGSFSVTRKDVRLYFKCHRASCNFRGEARVGGGSVVHGPDRQPFRRSGRERYASLGKGPLPPEVAELLLTKYGLCSRDVSRGLLRWSEAHSPDGYGRLILPILDHLGYPSGYVARKLDDQVGPKTYTAAEQHEGAWYLNRTSTHLIIVEDQLSALRISRHLNAVALLGTNLSESTLKAIKAGRYTRIFLALDRDAYPLSIKMAIRHRAELPLTVLRIPKDIKNMDVAEEETFVRSNKLHD
jgi:hypothetical protein